MGKVPALIGTGVPIFLCAIRLGRVFFLEGKSCVFTSCSVRCLLADGQRSEVSDVFKLHVKLLRFRGTKSLKF